MPSISSIEVGLMMKLNELAQRHGLRVSDVNAQYSSGETDELKFMDSNLSDPTKDQAFQKLKAALQLEGDKLVGTEHDIEDRLDNALAKAPQPRFR